MSDNKPTSHQTSMTFEDCFDNVQNTRDIEIYLDSLKLILEKYIVILSIKDTFGSYVPESVLSKLHEMGFSNLLPKHHRMYIGIINKGNIVFDKGGDKIDDVVTFSGKVCESSLFVTSKSWSYGNEAQIKIDDQDFSGNERGLNIVVYDPENRTAIDSMTYDSFVPKPTLYHINLELDDAFFDSHFFVPDKYRAEWHNPFKRKFFSNKKLNVREFENGLVLPVKTINGKRCGGACDANFRFVAGYDNFSHEAYKSDRCTFDSYVPQETEIEYIDETVLFGGIIIDPPGHLILETVANRLWYLINNIDSELKIAVIIIWAKDGVNFFQEIMDAFGFPHDRIISVVNPIRFKKLLVPDSSESMYLYTLPYEFTKEYSLFFEHIKNNIKPAEYKKIYISKSKSNLRAFIGEKYFIEFYQKHGFKIINPEDYTIKEKAELMLGADEIVTIAGTNHMFTAFCKPSTTITILTRVDNGYYGTIDFNMIRESIGCKNFYIVNTAAGFLHKNHTFSLYLHCVTREFKKYAKEVFQEEIDITPEESLKSVLMDYLKLMPEYYSNPIFFNAIKNQKMLTVLQNISELFLGKDFDTSKLDLSTNESNLQKQVTDLTLQKNNLTSQVSLLSAENTDLKASVDKLEEEKIEIISQREKNNELLESIQAEIKKLTAESEHFNSEKLLMKAEIELLHNEKIKLNDELLKAYKEKNEMGQKLMDLSEKETTLKLSVSQHEYRADMLTSENVRINSSLSDANHHIEELEKERDILKSRITEMRSTRSWRYTRIFRKNKKDEEI